MLLRGLGCGKPKFTKWYVLYGPIFVKREKGKDKMTRKNSVSTFALLEERCLLCISLRQRAALRHQSAEQAELAVDL